jgi:hypothetical protein
MDGAVRNIFRICLGIDLKWGSISFPFGHYGSPSIPRWGGRLKHWAAQDQLPLLSRPRGRKYLVREKHRKHLMSSMYKLYKHSSGDAEICMWFFRDSTYRGVCVRTALYARKASVLCCQQPPVLQQKKECQEMATRRFEIPHDSDSETQRAKVKRRCRMLGSALANIQGIEKSTTDSESVDTSLIWGKSADCRLNSMKRM